MKGILFLGFACGRCNVEVTSAAICFFWMGRFMEKSGKRRLPKTWALTTLLSVSKIGKPIGEVGCCESRMAEQSH